MAEFVAIVKVLVLVAVCAVAGFLLHPHAPDGDWVGWFASLLTEFVSWAAGMFNSYPALVIVIVAPVVINQMSTLHFPTPRHRRDPKRLFDAEQKRVGFERASHRCEMDNLWGTRCHRPAHHADHWLPWSAGGATNLPNFVAACRWHNLAKSAAWPSMWQSWKICHRRGRYFPPSAPREAGAKFIARPHNTLTRSRAQ